jgi:site-specific recombinase XerD
MIGTPGKGLVFKLPTQDGANKTLGVWVRAAGIDKHITWHSARHAFSVLLQQEGVDVSTVAGLLGHTSSKYVQQVYRRYTTNEAIAAIEKLPIY